MAYTHYSFAIVGAGPAGATCANALQLGGASSLVLIDKARFPRDKACGDAIGPAAIAILDELNLREILKPHRRVTLLSLTSFSGKMQLDTNLKSRRSPLGYVIPRLKFDEMLLRAALDRGVTNMTGWALEAATFSDQHWQLKLSCSQTRETRVLTADVLIGADGATSKLRRILGQPLNSDQHTSIAIRIYAKDEPLSPARQQLDIVKELPSPGYGWVFSTGIGEVNVGVGAEVAAYKSQGQHLKQMLMKYRAFLNSSLVFDEQSSCSSVLPLASELPRLGFPAMRAALIGDAASMINPLTGEGIIYGMYAGLQLGKRLAAAEKTSGDFAAAITGYEKDFQCRFGRHFRGIWLFRKMIEKPTLRDRIFASCARNPDLCYDCIEYITGDMPAAGKKPLYKIVFRTLFN